MSSSSSLSPPLPQYQTSIKRPLSPVRSLHPKLYSSTRLAACRRTPTIYTQAPQQPHHHHHHLHSHNHNQPTTTKSLPNNLNSPTSHNIDSSCTTTTTSACCNSRICSSHIGSAPCSSSNLQLSSHHHYHPNKFQSDVSSSNAIIAVSSSTPSSSSQHTLKPLPLPLPSVAGTAAGASTDNNASSTPLSFSSLVGGDNMGSGGSMSSTSSLYPHPTVHGGGSVTPTSTSAGVITSYKKKSSFLQRKKPILTRSEVSFFLLKIKKIFHKTVINCHKIHLV